MFRHTFRISVSIQHILVVPSSNQRLRSAKVKALLLQRCALRKFHVTDGQNTRYQITSDRRSKRAWSKCVLYIPCIDFLVEVQTNHWLHKYDACVITTWIWAQGVPRDLKVFVLDTHKDTVWDTPKVPFKIASIHSLHKLKLENLFEHPYKKPVRCVNSSSLFNSYTAKISFQTYVFIMHTCFNSIHIEQESLSCDKVWNCELINERGCKEISAIPYVHFRLPPP